MRINNSQSINYRSVYGNNSPETKPEATEQKNIDESSIRSYSDSISSYGKMLLSTTSQNIDEQYDANLFNVHHPATSFKQLKPAEPDLELVENLDRILANGYKTNSYLGDFAILKDGTYVAKSDDRYIVSIPNKDNLPNTDRIYDYMGRIEEETTYNKTPDGVLISTKTAYYNGKPRYIEMEKSINNHTYSIMSEDEYGKRTTKYDGNSRVTTYTNNYIDNPSIPKTIVEDNIYGDNVNIEHITEEYSDGKIRTLERYGTGRDYDFIEINDNKAFINDKEVSKEEADAQSKYKEYNKPKTEPELKQELKSKSEVTVSDGYILDKTTGEPVKVDVSKVQLKNDNNAIVLTDERGNVLAEVCYSKGMSEEGKLYFYNFVSNVNGIGAGTKIIEALVAKSKELGCNGLTADADGGCYIYSKADKPHTNLKFYYKMGFKAVDDTMDKAIRDCIDKGIDIPPMLNRDVRIEYTGKPYMK